MRQGPPFKRTDREMPVTDRIHKSKCIVRPFMRVWKNLRQSMTEHDYQLFYEVVDIDGTLGRRIYPGCGREYNPRYFSHWFGHGRCHWNVILPVWLLNRRRPIGPFEILTSERHSAIINKMTSEIYDPSYEASAISSSQTIESIFHKENEMQSSKLAQHILKIGDLELFKRFFDFAKEFDGWPSYMKEFADQMKEDLNGRDMEAHTGF